MFDKGYSKLALSKVFTFSFFYRKVTFWFMLILLKHVNFAVTYFVVLFNSISVVLVDCRRVEL